MAIEESGVECNIVGQAVDGKEGLIMFLNLKPDLLITDIEMPKMNGEELIKEIRQINQNIPIVAITSMVNEKIKQTLVTNGFVYVLHKPINKKLFSVLLNKISNKLYASKKGT